MRYRRLAVERLEPRRLLSGLPQFLQAVVFGDSLSDTGNDSAYASLLGYKTSNGRFTSDPTARRPARARASGTRCLSPSWESPVRRLPRRADRTGPTARPPRARERKIWHRSQCRPAGLGLSFVSTQHRIRHRAVCLLGRRERPAGRCGQSDRHGRRSRLGVGGEHGGDQFGKRH